jgi:hypothetical protein
MRLFGTKPIPPTALPPCCPYAEASLLLLGRQMAQQNRARTGVQSLAEVEFKVFSQWGDDGIIQWLLAQLEPLPHTFIEFGVEDYRESNTRFLLFNDNWSGLVMDGSPAHIATIQNADYYWKYELQARQAFVDRENINALLADWPYEREIGLLHIDIDGNDYWVWEALTAVSPVVAIVEYNSVFGSQRALTIPYAPGFVRSTKDHVSNLYYGASLAALVHLATTKGYVFIGSNSAGNNAYFVRQDRLPASLTPKTVAEGYVGSKFRESRAADGTLTLLTGPARAQAIQGLPVVNVVTGQTESF